jgi:hypothetical protein
MKERFGPKACLEAIMLMMGKPETKTDENQSITTTDTVEEVKAMTEQLINGGGILLKSHEAETDT